MCNSRWYCVKSCYKMRSEFNSRFVDVEDVGDGLREDVWNKVMMIYWVSGEDDGIHFGC